jgi:hypothetical protein
MTVSKPKSPSQGAGVVVFTCNPNYEGVEVGGLWSGAWSEQKHETLSEK